MELRGYAEPSIRLEWCWRQSTRSASADDTTTQVVFGLPEWCVPSQVRSTPYAGVRGAHHRDLPFPSPDTAATRYETILVTVPGFGRSLPLTDLPNVI